MHAVRGVGWGLPHGPPPRPPPPPLPPPAWACPQGGHRAEMVGRRLVPLEPRLELFTVPSAAAELARGQAKGTYLLSGDARKGPLC